MPASRTLRALLVTAVGLVAGCAPAVTPSAPPSASSPSPAAPTVSVPTASPSAAAIGKIPDVPFYRGDTLRSAIEPGPGPVAEPAVAWDVALEHDATVNPILVDGAVIAGTNHEVVALDAVTGAQRWTTPIDGQLEGAFSADAGVIVATATDAVHGLDSQTGAELWAVERESSQQRPEIVDGIAYLGSNDGRVIGIDVRSGTTTWSWQGPRRIQVRVDLVADGVVYVSTDDGRLFTVSIADGAEGWTYQIQGSRAVPSMAGDTVFVSSGLDDDSSPTGQVVALDVDTGTPRWRFSSPSGEQAVHGAARDGLVFVTTRADGMYALRDAGSSQATVWHADVPHTDWPSVLSGDVAYVVTREDGVFALDASDGQILWHTGGGGSEGRGPIVAGGRLYAIVGGHVIAWAEPSLLAEVPAATAAPGTTPDAGTAPGSPFSILRSFDQATTGVIVGPRTEGPDGIELDLGPDGLLYVLDLDAVVSVIDPATGERVRSWGGKGHGDGKFDGIHDIAVATDGRVYAADEGSHRVQVFDSHGTFIKQLGSFGTALGQFDRPSRVAVGPDGSLYVKDGATITRFGPDGNVDWRVGGPQADNAQLRRDTYDLAVLPDGRLLVTMDPGGPALLLDPDDGAVIGAWGPDLSPAAEPVVAADGTVWLYQVGDDRIDILGPDGAPLARHVPEPGPDRPNVLYPTPVVAPNGHAYTFGRDLGLVELAVDLSGG